MSIAKPPHNPHEVIPEAPDLQTAQRQYEYEQNAVATLPLGLNPFQEAMQGADVIPGYELQEKSPLVGIPFVITSATFRDGVPRPDKTLTNYVSLEAIIADRETLIRRVQMRRLAERDALAVNPGEAIVINDGSSGICRQIVAYLHGKGIIECPPGAEVGGSYSTRYDVYRAQWVKGFDVDNPDPRFAIALACPRGLRVSEYESDWGPAGTYYLA